MESKDRIRLERALGVACERGKPWYTLAELLYEFVEASRSPREVAEIKSVALDISGYSIGLLNRYIAVYARTKLLADEAGVPATDLLAPVFNGVEAAVKLCEYDPSRGLESLRQLNAGKTTLATIRARLSEAKDLEASRASIVGSVVPRRLGDITRDRRQATIMKYIHEGWAPLSGHYQKIDFRKSDRLLGCEGLFRVNRSDSETCGVEIVDGGVDPPFNYVDQILAASALRATFFHAYYLAFWTSASRPHAERAAKILDWLNVLSIGVLLVEKDGYLHPIRTPNEIRLHHVDRTGKLTEMTEQTYV